MFNRPLVALLSAGLLAIALSGPAPTLAAAPELTTVAEASGFVRTGRYQEVIQLCTAFAQRYPQAVRCSEFGRTPEGRPMLALAVSTSGRLTPEAARAAGLPVVLAQGGIHAGEIDGKDAVFWLLRDLLDGNTLPGALDHQVLLFVPVFNVDGHERFGRWNRPNQMGPEEMGWRTTAQNYNLNRDYAKADSPEMQAMLRLMQAWDPVVVADLHVTDGAKFEHDISIIAEPVHSGDAVLRTTGTALRDGIIAELAQRGALPLGFYPSFVVQDDPASGFEDSVAPPRFSTGYLPLLNRIGILVETHSWKDYATRVRLTRHTVEALLRLSARDGAKWQAQAADADRRAAKLAGQPLPLTWAATGRSRVIEFRGYAYTRSPSEISGALMTRYDDSRPELWRVPMRDEVLPSLTVTLPGAGYLVPAAFAGWAAARLDVHQLRYQRLVQAARLPVQAFRASMVERSAQSFEGHQSVKLSGAWAPETRDIAAGSLFVPIGQPRARLVAALLEPQAPDSWAAWGHFNNAFEAKEYMEDYVAEQVAREMLAQDPELAQAFSQRLATDAGFRADPRARLGFFASRHSSYDERLNLYPVLRVEQEPRLD